MPEDRGLFADDETREKLARLYRYAQVGHCVSSVTHDVNNFLGAILAYAELVGLEKNQTPEALRMLGEVMSAVRKSSRLISSLTDIARRERPDIRVVSPREVLETVLDLRRYDLRVARVDVETRYQDPIPDISADPPKLEQALLYLLSNAIEAVEGAEDRRIKLSLLAEHGRVEFRFWNPGSEIPASVRARMFEPLFTTKSGDHLGLGLWVARSIVREYGGDVVYEPDRGFSLFVPQGTAASDMQSQTGGPETRP